MSIILPNLNHSFISPVPVPDSGSGSGSGFPGFPYAPIKTVLMNKYLSKNINRLS